jgi:spermidine/putrescine-binding protein
MKVLSWSESTAKDIQRLPASDGTMVVNFKARVIRAANENRRNLIIAWSSGFWNGTDYWVRITKGTTRESAQKLLAFHARPTTQVELVKYLGYGLPTLAAYEVMPFMIKDSLPTPPDKTRQASDYSDNFGSIITQRRLNASTPGLPSNHQKLDGHTLWMILPL